MNAIILAGGKSSRFGRDKAFVKIDGTPIIKRQLQILRSLFKKIIIVTNNPDKYRLRGVKIIQDIIPDRGPLGGIYSGLGASDSIYNFFVACDMPFIKEALIRYIIKNRRGFDVVVPKINKKFHPLFGLYRKDCVKIIEKRLSEGRFNISGIFSELKCRFITAQEVRRFDRKMLSLVNINTGRDFEMAKKIRAV